MHFLVMWETPKRLTHIYLMIFNYAYFFEKFKSEYQPTILTVLS